MSGKVLEIVLKNEPDWLLQHHDRTFGAFPDSEALRAPRKYVCYLWMAVFLNLCLPFSVRGPGKA